MIKYEKPAKFLTKISLFVLLRVKAGASTFQKIESHKNEFMKARKIK
jgi:hypothetical protein